MSLVAPVKEPESEEEEEIENYAYYGEVEGPLLHISKYGELEDTCEMQIVRYSKKFVSAISTLVETGVG